MFYFFRGNRKAHLIEKYLQAVRSSTDVTEGQDADDFAGISAGANPLTINEIEINLEIWVQRFEVDRPQFAMRCLEPSRERPSTFDVRGSKLRRGFFGLSTC